VNKVPVVVDVFCGAGGLSFGLMNAGLIIKAGIDLDPASKYPFESNCRSKFLQKDVENVTSDELNQLFGESDVRVLAGCAPCQPFSTYSNTRKSADERWKLLNSFLRLSNPTVPKNRYSTEESIV
jgi:DNA (cytosine-5)-methyltransferase 1